MEALVVGIQSLLPIVLLLILLLGRSESVLLVLVISAGWGLACRSPRQLLVVLLLLLRLRAPKCVLHGLGIVGLRARLALRLGQLLVH